MPSFDDTRRRLAAKYRPRDRYSSFGPTLESLHITGFRGINALTLEIRSPITAFSGLNGTGKSTIAQLVCCAYKKAPTALSPRPYIKTSFPVSAADPEPFDDDAHVVYAYSSQGGEPPQQVTVRRRAREWSGYKRQPERACYYIGVAQFIPKIERRDFSIYSGRDLELGAWLPLPTDAPKYIGAILGLAYDDLKFIEINHRERRGKLAMAERSGGRRYSENHMGFGEGRIVYIVNAMEAAPAQSLFVLEEPETSLHGDAQRRLARYLVEVSDRRGHQIVLTTHSAAVLAELGRESVVYLRRSPVGELSATHGLSTYQIDSYLEKGVSGATVCVEDSFAASWATEIVRRCNLDLLQGCSFLPVGGGVEVSRAVRVLRSAGVRVAGLLDGDLALDGAEDDGIYNLPGNRPPEIEVFSDQAVVQHFANSSYQLDIASHFASIDDHHQYASSLASAAKVAPGVIVTEACRAYTESREPSEFEPMMRFLRGELLDRR